MRLGPLYIRKTKTHDILAVGEAMRFADKEEVWALNRHTPIEALTVSCALSENPKTAVLKGQPIALFGVVPDYLTRSCRPWVLGTDRMYEEVPMLMRASRYFLREWSKAFLHMCGTVHADNAASLRYLKRLGFTLSDPYTGATGATAINFTMEAASV